MFYGRRPAGKSGNQPADADAVNPLLPHYPDKTVAFSRNKWCGLTQQGQQAAECICSGCKPSIQGGLWYHGHSAADSATDEGRAGQTRSIRPDTQPLTDNTDYFIFFQVLGDAGALLSSAAFVSVRQKTPGSVPGQHWGFCPHGQFFCCFSSSLKFPNGLHRDQSLQ